MGARFQNIADIICIRSIASLLLSFALDTQPSCGGQRLESRVSLPEVEPDGLDFEVTAEFARRVEYDALAIIASPPGGPPTV